MQTRPYCDYADDELLLEMARLSEELEANRRDIKMAQEVRKTLRADLAVVLNTLVGRVRDGSAEKVARLREGFEALERDE